MNTARISIEGKRGCGYRKKGGLYLIAGEPSANCGRLPFELTVCPVCHAGIKQTRGWTWIQPNQLFSAGLCHEPHCLACPMGGSVPEVGGLLWIGTQFYKTPTAFLEEANRLGLSRRLTAVPKKLEVGKHWVYLAHPRAFVDQCECVVPGCAVPGEKGTGQKDCKKCKGKGETYRPGIFSVFKPTHIEKVVDRETPEEECEKLRKRGIEPVIVDRAEEGAESDQEV